MLKTSTYVKMLYKEGMSIAKIAGKLRLPMMDICVYLTSKD